MLQKQKKKGDVAVDWGLCDCFQLDIWITTPNLTTFLPESIYSLQMLVPYLFIADILNGERWEKVLVNLCINYQLHPKVIPFYSTSPHEHLWPNICSYQKPKKSSWISPSPSPLTSNQATSPTDTYKIQSNPLPFSVTAATTLVSLIAAVASIILPDFILSYF